MASLSGELAFGLGGDEAAPEPTPEPTPAIDPLAPDTAHGSAAIDRLIQQFKHKPNIVKLVLALAKRTQGLADVAVQLATQRGINSAVGVQLDNLGAKVGQPRNGLDDESYRIWIRARIRLNLCSGTIDEICGVFALVLSTVGGNTFLLETQYPAALVLRINNRLAADAEHFARILQQAKAGGVRAVLEWCEAADAATFSVRGASALAAGSSLSSAASPSDVTLTMAEATPFGASGFLVLASGAAEEETLAYAAVDATHLSVPGGVAFAHAIGVEAALADANGCGDATNEATGGGLAGARE